MKKLSGNEPRYTVTKRNKKILRKKYKKERIEENPIKPAKRNLFLREKNNKERTENTI